MTKFGTFFSQKAPLCGAFLQQVKFHDGRILIVALITSAGGVTPSDKFSQLRKFENFCFVYYGMSMVCKCYPL